MYFKETVEFDGNTYQVEGISYLVDNSFAHAFGIETNFEFEVNSLEITEAFDEDGECIEFSNLDKDLIYNLTQILEEKLNED